MSDESQIIIGHQYIIEHLMYYPISDSRLVDDPPDGCSRKASPHELNPSAPARLTLLVQSVFGVVRSERRPAKPREIALRQS